MKPRVRCIHCGFWKNPCLCDCRHEATKAIASHPAPRESFLQRLRRLITA